MVRSRLLQQRVDEGEVELSFDRFHLLPGDRHFERIRVERIDHRKHGLEHGRIVARIVGLRAEDQERLAIDDQGMAGRRGFRSAASPSPPHSRPKLPR